MAHLDRLRPCSLPALPAPAGRTGAGERIWLPAASFRTVLLDVLKVVTAFTVAHSVTLTAAVLGWVALPSRLTESLIAVSVVLAALNNVWPVLHGAPGSWRSASA